MSADITDAASGMSRADSITGWQVFLFAVAVGVIVTNLFAPQTLVGMIGPAFGFGAGTGGLVAMATLLGYAAGLFFLVPLADLLENRTLVLQMLGCAVVAATAAAFAPSAALLMVVLFALGAACSAIQILVPIAASMAEPERRGRVIGDVMSGLMIGILLARPAASMIADTFGWRAFYGTSAAVMTLLAVVLAMRLPLRRPLGDAGYPALVASLWHLLRSEPELRRHSFTASLSMAAFSLFWTSVALRLAEPPFDLGQRGIALFALAGAGGAAVTPLFGRAGDRGWTRTGTIFSHCLVVLAFAISAWAGFARSGSWLLPLLLLGTSAIILDVGVTGDQTLGRRVINLLQPEARGRLNGLFVGLFFLGGAAGSAVAGVAWAWGGWLTVCVIGTAIAVVALLADCVFRTQ